SSWNRQQNISRYSGNDGGDHNSEHDAPRQHADAVYCRAIEDWNPAKVSLQPNLDHSDYGNHDKESPQTKNNTWNASEQLDRIGDKGAQTFRNIKSDNHRRAYTDRNRDDQRDQ